jgi:hypothetical protein
MSPRSPSVERDGRERVFSFGVVCGSFRLVVSSFKINSMRVHLDFSALRKTRWNEYSVRFLFGGAITLATGFVAKHFGPVVGGLFLAFPAIFPASVTLVAKHEREKKQKAGMDGTARGEKAAALDARGAAIGTFGLGFFALLIWKLLPIWNWMTVLGLAILAWLVVSILIWNAEQHQSL